MKRCVEILDNKISCMFKNKVLYPTRPKIFEFKSSGLSINTGISGGEDHQTKYTNFSQNIASLKPFDVNVLTDNMSRN